MRRVCCLALFTAFVCASGCGEKQSDPSTLPTVPTETLTIQKKTHGGGNSDGGSNIPVQKKQRDVKVNWVIPTFPESFFVFGSAFAPSARS